MTGHDDKSKQLVSLVGEIQKGVSYDSGQLRIAQVSDWAIPVQELIDEFENQLVFSRLPLRGRHVGWLWA